MATKKTHQQFLDEVSAKGIQVEVLGTYVNNQTPISCKCKKCGLVWNICPNNLLRGTGCPACAGNYQRTPKDFIKDLRVRNPNIELVGTYVNMSTKTDFVCKICNYKWSSTPTNIFAGRGCPRCGVIKRTAAIRKPHEKFKEEIGVLCPNITLLGEYVNNRTKIKCKCEVCSHEWLAFPMRLRSVGCPKCAHKPGKTHQAFVDELAAINPDVELLDPYTNARTRVKCRCKVCKFEWNALPTSLLKGAKCPMCKKWRREQAKFKFKW